MVRARPKHQNSHNSTYSHITIYIYIYVVFSCDMMAPFLNCGERGIVVEPRKAGNRYGMWMSRLKTTIVYVFESIIALAGTYLCVRHFLSPAAAVAALYDREYNYMYIHEPNGDNHIIYSYK